MLPENTGTTTRPPEKYRVWTWKHPFILHWIMNPGLLVNELILGQRVPRTIWVEKDFSKTLEERTKIPCPHCGTVHSGLKWSTENNAFKNWFGLYCDHCGNIIPCLTNLGSCIVLGITFPVWIWFKNTWKRQWLSKQAARYAHLDLQHIPNRYAGLGWIKEGISWAFFTYLLVEILFPLIMHENYQLKKLLLSIPLWLLGGLGYGYTLKLINGKKRTEIKTK